jgi:DNA-binding winged helix-turn-helix (wHTH) protein
MKEFPPFRLDTVNQCLWRRRTKGADERILLTPKAFGVLRYLVEHAGQLVTHDELLDAVWPNTHIQPQAIKKLVLDLRSTLGDPAKKPLFIETLHRRGYRFIAAVSEGTAVLPTVPAQPARGKLVGRERELSELGDCLGKALRGERQIPTPQSAWSRPSLSVLNLSRFVPLKMKRRGVETRIIIAAGNDLPRKVDTALLKAVARSRAWFEELASGQVRSLADIARRENITRRYVERLAQLAFTAPTIVEAICQGKQPAELSTETLLNRIELPLLWSEQPSVLAFS